MRLSAFLLVVLLSLPSVGSATAKHLRKHQTFIVISPKPTTWEGVLAYIQRDARRRIAARQEEKDATPVGPPYSNYVCGGYSPSMWW